MIFTQYVRKTTEMDILKEEILIVFLRRAYSFCTIQYSLG